MPSQELHVVTGAFGYSGKYIAAPSIEIDGYQAGSPLCGLGVQ